jgi:hypothetical protein
VEAVVVPVRADGDHPQLWAGLATGAATCLSFIVGGLDVTLVGILGLLAIGLTLTASPVVYRTVGKLQTVIIAEVVIWLVIAVFAGTTADAWGDFVKGFRASARSRSARTRRSPRR